MTHVHRPLHTGRLFAQGPFYPVRESDGDDWHVGVMVDARQAHIAHARDSAAKFLQQARAARLAGDDKGWSWNFSHASAWRKHFGELAR